ncbi:hypothetical protein [Mycobacterium sp. 1164985.4]|uniref:hypothetical protein n=1 Tax=Mycobacterium sp. 1164985.4 TaxID=1834069 RepID=UPI000AB6BEE6|nr:hypothetical protein [Mycobacterium sp. 1164985.4]
MVFSGPYSMAARFARAARPPTLLGVWSFVPLAHADGPVTVPYPQAYWGRTAAVLN